MAAQDERDRGDWPPRADNPTPFGAGEPILWRGLDERGRVISVIPARVVQDEPELVALWLPLGTRTVKPELVRHVPGEPRRWTDGNWYLTEGHWRWAELLVLMRPQDAWATWVRWSVDRIFQGWAVNMQGPPIRTYLGFDHHDHQLDIVVQPDRTWRWKDTDELELSVELGRMSRAQADAVKADAHRAVAEIESGGFPYSGHWERWRPDPSWTLPELHSQWADVSMHN